MPIEYLIDLYSYIYKIKRLPFLREGNLENNCFFIFLFQKFVIQCLPMQETQVQSLGWEDPLEKEVAAHFSTLAWKIPWTEEPGRLQPMGSQRVGHD